MCSGSQKVAMADLLICVCSRKHLELKPFNVSFEEAAAAPMAALTALQGMRDRGHINPRQ
jgi:NADPH:quinone reductase-like Zn-dependent oxidoreductase